MCIHSLIHCAGPYIALPATTHIITLTLTLMTWLHVKKLSQNYFSLRRRPSTIILSARGNLPEIISKLFYRLIAAHEYFQHVHCR